MATYNLATWLLPGTNTLLNDVDATVDTAGNLILGGTITASNLPTGTPLLAANNLNDVANKPMSLSNLGAVPLAGATMTGNLILNGNPSTNLQAVTKQYADNLTAGVDYKTATQFGTTAAIVGTYLNGASGVGATITYTATGAISIDGNTPSVGDRILVKDQVTTFQNGIYVVTVVGTTGVSGVLTRAGDYDDSSPAQIGLNDLVPIIGGTVNAGAIWRQTNPGPFTVGTTPITFVIYSVGTYTAGAGISIAGNVISVPNGGISYARIQNETNATLLGNPTGAPAAPSEITLNATLSFTGTTLQRAALTGDVTASAGSNATTIAANAVTYAKFQQVAAVSLVGNPTGSLANASGITLNANLGFSGSTLQVLSTPALSSATTTVNVSSATAPSAGQILTATSSTAATWQGAPKNFLQSPYTNGKWINLAVNFTTSGVDTTIYTVPAGKTGLLLNYSFYNTTGSSDSTFRMATGGPDLWVGTLSANAVTGTFNNLYALPSGNTLFVFTSAGSPNYNIFATILEVDNTFPVTVASKTSSFSVGDNLIYTCPSGKTAYPLGVGNGANTTTVPSSLIAINRTGGNVTAYFKFNGIANGPGTVYSNLSTTGITACTGLSAGQTLQVNTSSTGTQSYYVTMLEI